MGVPYSLFGGGGSSSKRPHEDSDEDEVDSNRIPARKKLKTADYIYEQLFVKGCGSDVTVHALGKEWNLHKIYLSQSPYFSSMFNGNWVESRQKSIQMSVPNSVITIKSLDQAFGSLYHDEIDIDCDEVINLVAAATLLQLDCLVSQCADVMLENIRLKYVISYYIASEENGLTAVKEACLKWLRTNLLRWLYVKCEQEVAKSSKKNIPSLKSVANAWLADFKGKKESFLETVSGLKFASVFSALRLQNILALEKSVHVIIDDNIIPRNITDQYLALKWQMQLCIENENKTDEPNEEASFLKEIDPTFFYKCAIRCGRDLAQDIPINWRWTGYNHGIDILISHRYRLVDFKLSAHRSENEKLASTYEIIIMDIFCRTSYSLS
uniref:BTB domain-containing protein n=1 Tax=Romanomermis culicivorax TaxID=13658 RepID=A0A915KA74_ROMCU